MKDSIILTLYYVEEEEEEDEEGLVGSKKLDSVVSNSSTSVPLDRRRSLTNDDFAMIERLKEAYSKRLKDPRNRSGLKKLNNSLKIDNNMSDVDGQAVMIKLDDNDEETPTTPFMVTAESLAPQAKTGSIYFNFTK